MPGLERVLCLDLNFHVYEADHFVMSSALTCQHQESVNKLLDHKQVFMINHAHRFLRMKEKQHPEGYAYHLFVFITEPSARHIQGNYNKRITMKHHEVSDNSPLFITEELSVSSKRWVLCGTSPLS